MGRGRQGPKGPGRETVVAQVERTQPGQFGSGSQGRDVPGGLVEARVADGRLPEDPPTLAQGELGGNAHPLDKAAAELPLAHPRPQRRHPVRLVSASNSCSRAADAGLTLLVPGGTGALALDADEGGAGGAGLVAALLQPVGEDQTVRIVVGILDNRPDESLLKTHALPLARSSPDRLAERGDYFKTEDRLAERGDYFKTQDRLAERGDYFKTEDRLAERGDYIKTASRSEATTLRPKTASRSEATALCGCKWLTPTDDSLTLWHYDCRRKVLQGVSPMKSAACLCAALLLLSPARGGESDPTRVLPPARNRKTLAWASPKRSTTTFP